MVLRLTRINLEFLCEVHNLKWDLALASLAQCIECLPAH